MEKFFVQPPSGVPASLVVLYLRNCLDGLADAKCAMGRSDLAHTSIFGHRLKGTGAAYGIPLLTEMGSNIEAACLVNNTDEIDRQLVQLEKYLRRIEVTST